MCLLVNPAFRSKPLSGGKQCTAHDAARPNIAVESTLVAQSRHQSDLTQKFIELGAVFGRNPVAQPGHFVLGHPAILMRLTINCQPDARDEHVGHFYGCGFARIQSVEQPVADHSKIRPSSLTQRT